MRTLTRFGRVLAGMGAPLLLGGAALADTSDVVGYNRVLVEKAGAHCVDDPHCFNRYHPAIEPVAHAKPGDLITFETRDALDSDLNLTSTPDDLAAIDLNLVHPMTGPVYVEGAKRGDAVAITFITIVPDDYGYTTIVPGFGFLRDKFPEPYVANWRLNSAYAVSEQLPGIKVPMNAFTGSIGTMPGEPEIQAWKKREADLAAAGGVALQPQPIGALPKAVCGPEGSHKDDCLRTIPPRENGGNIDVKQMQVGTTLLLPCFVDGCGLFIGDVHYAQGDGEVSGTAIEMGATVTVMTEIREGAGAFIKGVQIEGGPQLKNMAPSEFYATTGFPKKESGDLPIYMTYLDSEKIAPLENLSEDLTLAARNALLEMLDYLVREHGLTREQAYVLSSVAVDLRVGQVVDVPNYVMTAVLDLGVFE